MSEFNWDCKISIYTPDTATPLGEDDHHVIGVIDTGEREYPIEIWRIAGTWHLRVDGQESYDNITTLADAAIIGVNSAFASARTLFDQAWMKGYLAGDAP
jgi:hypothetical protein